MELAINISKKIRRLELHRAQRQYLPVALRGPALEEERQREQDFLRVPESDSDEDVGDVTNFLRSRRTTRPRSRSIVIGSKEVADFELEVYRRVSEAVAAKQKADLLMKLKGGNVVQLLEDAPGEIKGDREFVLNAIEAVGPRDVTNVLWKCGRFNGDEEVISKAVEKRGWALQNASKSLRDKEDIVLKAVRNYGLALKFASERLRAEKGVVLEAVKQNGTALQYASEALKVDKEVVQTAAANGSGALKWLEKAKKLQAERQEQPDARPLYQAVATYDSPDPQRPGAWADDLVFKKGDVIQITEYDPSLGEWLKGFVESAPEYIGYVPLNFLSMPVASMWVGHD